MQPTRPDPAVISLLRVQLVRAATALDPQFVDDGAWGAMQAIKIALDQIARATFDARQEVVLADLEQHGQVSVAARKAGVRTSVVDEWCNRDPDFKERFAEARVLALATARAKAMLIANTDGHKEQINALKAAHDALRTDSVVERNRQQMNVINTPYAAMPIIYAPVTAKLQEGQYRALPEPEGEDDDRAL